MRLAAAGLFLRALLRPLALAFGLMAAERPKPSDEWFTPWWWYLQEVDGWVVLLAFGGAGNEAVWLVFLVACFVAVSVLYTVVGVRVWRGGRVAGRVATVLMVLGAVQSLLVLFGSATMAADGDRSIMPFGHGPIADRLSVATLFAWPLALLVLAVAVVILVNTRAAREYPGASDRAVSAALLDGIRH